MFGRFGERVWGHSWEVSGVSGRCVSTFVRRFLDVKKTIEKSKNPSCKYGLLVSVLRCF